MVGVPSFERTVLKLLGLAYIGLALWMFAALISYR